MVHLSNGILEIEVSNLGAELQSLRKVKSEFEYIWTADPVYWDRRSPILFPTVGNVWEHQFRVDGQPYPMGQHGFARDRRFEIVKSESRQLIMRQESDEETLQLYPFPYCLEIGYTLLRNVLKATWQVKNTGNKDMPFHIGAHPGFNLPDYQEEDSIHGYLDFNINDKLVSTFIEPGGYAADHTFDVPLTEGRLPLTGKTFECDTILDRTGRIDRVTLYNKKGRAHLTVRFDMPILALWAPNGGQAPFVCIEPWQGCCDPTGYCGELKDRPYTTLLAPGETFTTSYDIIVE